MCVCVGSIYFTSVSTIFDWISEAVLTVWIFYSFYFSTCICVLGYPCICVLGYPCICVFGYPCICVLGYPCICVLGYPCICVLGYPCICVLGYPCICVLGYPFDLCLRFSIGFWELFRQSYFLFYNVNLLIGFHFITELFFSLNLYNIYAPFDQKRTVGYSVC
jgi:hypothetical protein